MDEALILIHEEKISSVKELLPAAGAVKLKDANKPLLDHRRGHRGRGAGHARRQQAARHHQVLRGQGPRLR